MRQTGQAAAADTRLPYVVPPIPGEQAREQDQQDVGLLAQVIASRLFSAGLDLHFVLMMTRDGPAMTRLEHAVDELDDAIKELRHLMLAYWERGGSLPQQPGRLDRD